MDFLDRTLENFREYLKENTESKNTVKNYVSDLRIFLIFLDSRHSPLTAENFSLFLNTQTLSEFENYLSVINPPATLNRRVSSVKKFFDYYIEHHPLPLQTNPPVVTFSSPVVTTPITNTQTPSPDISYSNSPSPSIPQEITTVLPAYNLAPDNTPAPEIIGVDATQAQQPISESNENLLRLLPQEILDSDLSTSGAHRVRGTPSGLLSKFKIHIICTVSFLIGFFATIGLYPILYP